MLKDLTKNYNYISYINDPTRQSTCIDLILSNISNASSSILHLNLSDHDTAQMLSYLLKKNIYKTEKYFIYKRGYSDENVKKFNNAIKSLTFGEVYQEKDFNAAFDKFHELYTLFYNLCFPKIRIKIDTSSTKQTWITRRLKISCKSKRTLRFLYYKNKKK